MIESYFINRRSCRNFSKENIADKQIEEIIKEAAKAPTCGNMQLYSIIVTRDEENKKKLSAMHYNQTAATTSSVILTICADFNRFTRWCKLNNADAGYDNFHSFITAATDAIILAQQIVTIAELKGYGTCYLGTVTYNAEEISNLLRLPELVIPVASLAIGEIKESGEKTERLPLQAILHNEHYRNDSDQDIISFYKIHDENPENARFIVENGKENLAQVFAEVRYPREMNEKISKTFANLIKTKGFD